MPCVTILYPKPFKAQVVQECLQPGAFVASVSMSHGINANVVRKWLPLYRDQQLTDLPAFLPVKLEQNIQNESPSASSFRIYLSLIARKVGTIRPISSS